MSKDTGPCSVIPKQISYAANRLSADGEPQLPARQEKDL
jgi:hypothetical protein